ncbi:hypothetical protein [Krasilnikovia sp. MM14-A1004]|uniref:hypothetical protein n=1 Tax=Krasilnikovia sp. MM14-A1004 TaxID=3373541 RepID=UPI00399D5022
MERGSSKHSSRVDEQMKHEVLGTVQGIAGGRAEEWKMAEPAGEDQPDPTRTAGIGTLNGDLSRFGRYIGLSALPGDRRALRHSALTLEAPEDVLADLDSLPDGVVYQTVVEIWAALGRRPDLPGRDSDTAH